VDLPIDMNGHELVLGHIGNVPKKIMLDHTNGRIITHDLEVETFFPDMITFRDEPGDSNKIAMVAFVTDDQWIYPNVANQMASGPSWEVQRMAIRPDTDWDIMFPENEADPGSNVSKYSRPTESTSTTDNSVFTVFTKNNYWQGSNYSNSAQSAFDAPAFEIAGNPRFITGAHQSLQYVDTYGFGANDRYSDRPAMTTINLPQLFSYDSHDMRYPRENEAFAEPDAFAIKFGYNNQAAHRGAGADPTQPLKSTERGISFRAPFWNNNTKEV